MLRHEVVLSTPITPKQIAEELWHMYADQQIELINELGNLISEYKSHDKWNGINGFTAFRFQMREVLLDRDKKLAEAGHKLLEVLGDVLEEGK